MKPWLEECNLKNNSGAAGRFFLPFFLAATILSGCGSDSDDDSSEVVDHGDENGVRALTQGASLSGVVNPVGDVDWYSLEVKESSVVGIYVHNEALRADVDLLVTVYEKDSQGNLNRLAADHAVEDSSLASRISLNVLVDTAKTLEISVRDLNDDNASTLETYYISYDIAEPEDGNSSFANAVTVAPGGACHQDSIGNVGDVDVIKFSVDSGSVFNIATEYNAFSSGSPVDLHVSLFDKDGVLVRAVSKSSDNVFRLVEALPASEYFAVIKDNGQDDFDTASSFTTCITQSSSAEVQEDDVKEDANVISGSGTFNIEGSLDYAKDEDWNQINTTDLINNYVKVLAITFDPTQSQGCESWFLVEVTDSSDTTIFSKEYSSEVLATTVHVRVKVAGEHFVRITAIDESVCSTGDLTGAAYAVTLTEMDIDDPAELTVDGNDSESSADEIDEESNQSIEGLIGYLGDVDWYSVKVPNAAEHQVLELFFETQAPTNLEYYVIVKKDGNTVKSFTGTGSETDPVSFKTSFLIPAQAGSSNREYQIKVSDLRSDEGDIDTPYTIRSNIFTLDKNAPPLPADAATYGIADVVYASESDEQDAIAVNDSKAIELDVFGDLRKGVYDTTVLDFDGANLVADPVAKTSTLTFPWVSGYMDFDGDRDWFRLDLPALYTAAGGIADVWYSDIQIQLYTPGSIVEYAWAIYRDTNDNGRLEERRSNNDGYFSTAGDKESDTGSFYLLTPGASDTPLWVNHKFATATNPFYLALADVEKDEVGTIKAKNDWGYDGAYFVSLKLVFHEEMERPE